MIVVKFGGHAMVDENGVFSAAIATALTRGESVVVVHGGGPQIDAALTLAGIKSHFLGGFRYTSPQIFDILERVLVNEVGVQVAATLLDHGIPAQSMSGRTLPTLIAQKKLTLVDGTPAELGHVGEVIAVDTRDIDALLAKGIVPVISPVSADHSGDGGLNVNADLAAAAIAGAMDASVLIIMTDVPGIYRNWPDRDSLIVSITCAELRSLKSTFKAGMAPKVQAVLDAIAQGAKAVRIIDGTNPQSFAAALDGVGGTLVNA